MSSRNSRKRQLDDPGPSSSSSSSSAGSRQRYTHQNQRDRSDRTDEDVLEQYNSRSDRSEPPNKKRKSSSEHSSNERESTPSRNREQRRSRPSHLNPSRLSTQRPRRPPPPQPQSNLIPDQVWTFGKSILDVGVGFFGSLVTFASGPVGLIEENTEAERDQNQEDRIDVDSEQDEQDGAEEHDEEEEEEDDIIDLTKSTSSGSSSNCTTGSGSGSLGGDPYTATTSHQRRLLQRTHTESQSHSHLRQQHARSEIRHRPYPPSPAHSYHPSTSTSAAGGSLRETLLRQHQSSVPQLQRYPSHSALRPVQASPAGRSNGYIKGTGNGLPPSSTFDTPTSSSQSEPEPEMASDFARRLKAKAEVVAEARRDKKFYKGDGIPHSEDWRTITESLDVDEDQVSGGRGMTESVGRSVNGYATSPEKDRSQHGMTGGGICLSTPETQSRRREHRSTGKGKGRARDNNPREKPLPALPDSPGVAPSDSAREFEKYGLKEDDARKIRGTRVITGGKTKPNLGGQDADSTALEALTVARGERPLEGDVATRYKSQIDGLWKTIGRNSREEVNHSGARIAATAGLGRKPILYRSSRDLLRTVEARKSRPDEKYDLPVLADLKIRDAEEDAAIRKKISPPKPRLPKLTKEELQNAETARKNRRFAARCLREQVEYKDIQRLDPGQWLNDEIINFYGAMIQKRADEDMIVIDGVKKKRRDIHFFNSFFFKKMDEQGYQKATLKRWTKTFDIFKKDIVIFPINLGNMHWVCAAINFRDKRIEFYDSYSDEPRDQVYSVLREYLECESQDKKKQPFDFTGWVDYWDSTAPQQSNGVDCGVFTCQTLEHRGRGLGDAGDEEAAIPWEFEQRNISFIRLLMVHEIQQGRLVSRGNAPDRALE